MQIVSHDMYEFFQRCYLVNLKRRNDRLLAFQANAEIVCWPFKPVQIFTAIDGEKVETPEGWQSGNGAWGCMQSHRQIVERCLMDDINTVLVLEDDAVFPPGFAENVTKFLNEVPNDWEGLWLGGQFQGVTWEGNLNGGKRRNVKKREAIKPGIVRAYSVERTHAYALRGKAIMQALYKLWHKSPVHCDWVLGNVQEKHKVYCPDPFLVGQREGFSDIAWREKGTEFWSGTIAMDPNAKVVWLKDTGRDVMEELRKHGFHSGYWRHEDGRDKGLADIFDDPKLDEAAKVEKLESWIKCVTDEATRNKAGGGKSVATIWYPKNTDSDGEIIRKAAQDRLFELISPTVETAIGAAIKAGVL